MRSSQRAHIPPEYSRRVLHYPEFASGFAAGGPITQQVFNVSTKPFRQNNFIRFLGYVRPYAWLVALGALGGVVKFTVPLIIPPVTGHLIDNVFQNAALSAQDKLWEI